LIATYQYHRSTELHKLLYCYHQQTADEAARITSQLIANFVLRLERRSDARRNKIAFKFARTRSQKCIGRLMIIFARIYKLGSEGSTSLHRHETLLSFYIALIKQNTMALSTLFLTTLVLGSAAASDHMMVDVPNQLETARLPQQAQRVEFGIAGDNSAFKFSFSDPVRSHDPECFVVIASLFILIRIECQGLSEHCTRCTRAPGQQHKQHESDLQTFIFTRRITA
jgi:hypothetical protein